MPRKGSVAKRDVLPDPVYNSKLVTRLINHLMIDGKRGKASTILYDAFDMIKKQTGNEPLDVFEEAMKTLCRSWKLKLAVSVVLTTKCRSKFVRIVGPPWAYGGSFSIPVNAVNIRWTNAWLKKSWTPLTTPVPQ